MKTSDAFDWKRLLIILAPAVLILSSAGTLAWPSLEEMRNLKDEESRTLAMIDEATSVLPHLEAYRKADIDAAEVVETWLASAVPHTHSPRLFLLDIKLAEQESGIRVKSCQRQEGDLLPRDLEPDGSPKGSLWDLKVYGTFLQVVNFCRGIQSGDRLYTLRRVQLQRTKKGRINMTLRIFVHGLTPKVSPEGTGQ